ncbi:hypothetical protein ACFL1I_00135 [Candidatus Omnitrophota bacterium]
MNKKIKILLIFLGIVSLLGLALAVWIYFSAQTNINRYVQEQAKFTERNDYLEQQLNAMQGEINRWKDKSESTLASLNRLGKEHTVLKNRYDTLVEERKTLLTEQEQLNQQLLRLKRSQAQPPSLSPRLAQPAAPTTETSDEFLSSLLEERAILQVEVEGLKQQVIDLETEVRPAQRKASRLEEEQGDLVSKVEAGEKVSTVLSKDLWQEKKRNQSLQKEISNVEQRLQQVISEKDKLADELDKVQQALEQRLFQLDKTKEVLQGAVAGARKVTSLAEPISIELSPIVVKAEERTSAKPSSPIKTASRQIAVPVARETFELAGRVIKVNSRYKFVVIDIGQVDGVKKGMSFEVFRNDQKVGQIKVIETRQNIAACDVKELKAKGFQLNDLVRR